MLLQQVWTSGDYNKIAALTVSVDETVMASAEVAPGEAVLDVATGTGHAVLAAARVGAPVTGIDYVPALLDIAREWAAGSVCTSISGRLPRSVCSSGTESATSPSRRSA